MRIFVTADPELPVPPKLYGGIERVIALLVTGLHDRGHHVTLFGHADSEVPCELVAYPGRTSASAFDAMRNAALIVREVRRRRPDVVHSFGRLAYLMPILPLALPKVMTYQRQVTASSVRWGARLAHGSLTYTGCSRNLIEPVRAVGNWRVIYNAVPIDRYVNAPSVAVDAPLVFLGRIEAIKGPHIAVQVAHRAGRRLVIAGNVPDTAEAQAYFRCEIEPHVDGRQVSYVGPVDDTTKSALLSQASALLMPVLWDEPFGIVMAEALACGTPVIGFDRGAVPEVVDDGVTGAVCGDEAAMVAAVGRLAEFDRAACRRAAERRFSGAALVAAYESLYVELADARKAA